MPYRDTAAPPVEVFEVRPLPPRRALAIAGLVALGLGVAGLVAAWVVPSEAPVPLVLECTRTAGDAAGTCTLRGDGATRSLPASSITAVRAVQPRSGSREDRPAPWQITIWQQRRWTVVAVRSRRDEASLARRSLRGFLDDRAVPRVQLATPRGRSRADALLVLVGASLLLVGATLLFQVGRLAGRLRVAIDRGAGVVGTSWKAFGLARLGTVTPLAEVEAVDVEAVASATAEGASRVILRHRDGRLRPLGPTMRVHWSDLRARLSGDPAWRRLGAALGGRPGSAGDRGGD